MKVYKVFCFFILGLLGLLLSSCASIDKEEELSGNLLVHDICPLEVEGISLTQQHLQGQIELYLWGNYPSVGKRLAIDEILFEQGHREVCELEVRVRRSMRNWVSLIVSFGMYIPLEYRLNYSIIEY